MGSVYSRKTVDPDPKPITNIHSVQEGTNSGSV